MGSRSLCEIPAKPRDLFCRVDVGEFVEAQCGLMAEDPNG